MTAAEKGWQPIEGGEERETHGFSGHEAMLRSGADEVVDPALIKTVAELPPEEKIEAHREIEIEAQLTKEELVAAKATLEKQKAKIVSAPEMEQVWYDARRIFVQHSQRRAVPTWGGHSGSVKTCRFAFVQLLLKRGPNFIGV